jgi:hypothetical protein
MFSVPKESEVDFETLMNRKSVYVRYRPHYKKWLRYYWDFCHKYHYPVSEKQSLPHFAGKLREKRQTEALIRQATDAISHYYDMIGPDFVRIDPTEPPDPGTAIKYPCQITDTENKVVVHKAALGS